MAGQSSSALPNPPSFAMVVLLYQPAVIAALQLLFVPARSDRYNPNRPSFVVSFRFNAAFWVFLPGKIE